MRQKLWVAPLALVFAVGGCDDMLVETPQSFLTTSTYYQTAPQLEAGVLAAYNSVRSAFSATHGQWWGATGLASDQEDIHPTEVNVAKNADFLFWTAETPGGVDSGWQNLFRAIYRVNLVLSREAGVTMSEAQRSALVAEARFLRGYSYMMLDRYMSAGNKPSDLSVPLLLTEEDHANLEVARATSAEIQAQALADLTAAEAALPTASQRGSAGRGRATKGAAQMALADLYLWRSSFMLTNEWQQASDWAKKVIDSNQYSLVETGWFNTFNPSAKTNNTEYIYFQVSTGTAGRATSQFVNLHAPRDLGFGTGGGFGTNRATHSHVASYADGDIRGRLGGTDRVGMFETDTVAYRNYACSATTRFTGSSAGPNGGFCGPLPYNSIYPYKFRPSALIANQGNVDIPLYRYAETLLMYAEAQNELGNTAEAIRYVNMVRARARLGATGSDNRVEPADLPASMGKLAAREAIYMERNFELAHENKRWVDMVRRDSLEPGYWINSFTQNEPDAFALLPDLAQRSYLKRFPVPDREIDVNPALVQNPGY